MIFTQFVYYYFGEHPVHLVHHQINYSVWIGHSEMLREAEDVVKVADGTHVQSIFLLQAGRCSASIAPRHGFCGPVIPLAVLVETKRADDTS